MRVSMHAMHACRCNCLYKPRMPLTRGTQTPNPCVCNSNIFRTSSCIRKAASFLVKLVLYLSCMHHDYICITC